MQFLHSGLEIFLRRVQAGDDNMNLRIIGLLRQELIDLFLSFFQVTGGDEQVRQIDASRIIPRLQLDRAVKFFVGVAQVLQLKVGPSHLIVGSRKPRI